MGDVTAELENVKAARAGSGQATMTELGSGGFFGAFDSKFRNWSHKASESQARRHCSSKCLGQFLQPKRMATRFCFSGAPNVPLDASCKF